MVCRILELYLKQKEDYRKRSIQVTNVKYNLIVTYICLIIFSVLGIVNLFIQIPDFFFIELIIFALLYMLLFIMDRKYIKKSNDRVKAYDSFLVELQEKLIINGVNWTETQRIDYLISECDNFETAKRNNLDVYGYLFYLLTVMPEWGKILQISNLTLLCRGA